jgi:hypothetical protein
VELAGARRLLLGLAGLFALLVSQGLHGYSLAWWHRILDASPPEEILLGEARGIRSDDWAVALPLALAQTAHDPAFPLVNRDVGLGQSMLVPFAFPVRHALALFRPTTWGFFLGGDTGLAWQWWCGALGLFAVWLCVCLELSAGAKGLSLAAAALLLFSPFFQFWSLQAASAAIHAGLFFLAFRALASARSTPHALAAGLLLGFAGGGLLLLLYPPHQLPLAGLLVALIAGDALARRAWRAPAPAWRRRALGGGLALAIVALAALGLAATAGDAIERLRESVYPGARRSAGGDLPLWQLLDANLWSALQVRDYGLPHNICEAAGFWLLWPVTGAAVAGSALLRRERPDPLALALALYCAAVTSHALVGAPEPLARALLLDRIPPRRALLGLGLADALLLVRWLSCGPVQVPGRAASLALAAAFAALLAWCARALHATYPETRPVWLAALVLANGALAFLVLRRTRGAAVVAGMAAGVFASTAWFNPLAVGGAAYLAQNPLAQAILEIDRGAGGASVWVSYGHPYVANLFRAIGVRALDGVHPVPQLELWRPLDPDGRAREVYDRFAHVVVVPPEPGRPRFRLEAHDGFSVALDPQGDELARLGVTHLLVRPRAGPGFEVFRGLEPLARVGHYKIFELPRRAPAGAPAQPAAGARPP